MSIEAQAQAIAAQTGKPVAVCRAGLLWTAADIAEAHGIGDPKNLRASAMRILQAHDQRAVDQRFAAKLTS